MAKPVRSYTRSEIAMVRGMVLRGDRQQDVALYMNMSASTVNRFARDPRYQHIEPATNLPPPGPYSVYPTAQVELLRAKNEATARVLADLRRILDEYV